jgi:hypothetical protein
VDLKNLSLCFWLKQVLHVENYARICAHRKVINYAKYSSERNLQTVAVKQAVYNLRTLYPALCFPKYLKERLSAGWPVRNSTLTYLLLCSIHLLTSNGQDIALKEEQSKRKI